MNRRLYFASAVAACASLLASCEDKLPESKVFPYETSLISIKIVNAGADGNTVVEGVVDEDNKQVTFPKLDKDSPLSALKVEATVSDGAELTETTYDFSMEEGEYVAIMGPSGSGKTTLMNIVGCLDQATSGRLILDGQDISKCSDNQMSDIRLQKIGFVFQNFQLLARQSAMENVCLPLTYAGVPKKERRERAAIALERVGLGDRMSFKPTQLSGGQKQRVAIARAIVNHPKILLADEPTGALDSHSGEQVMELFQSLNDEGVSILMITHDAEIASMAQRTVEIRDGMMKSKEVAET